MRKSENWLSKPAEIRKNNIRQFPKKEKEQREKSEPVCFSLFSLAFQ
ncbi:hypothetical protein BFAG_03896 [Bacteroides fragilis 3_1_12]|uniref:Uncharacterized protein n=1 Tax=Bacteroides fragilis 3_1_12 TaxID=457424 RepID=A0ABN0BQM6_BACFG|nr:hypothetical protein BFAG_03896 [Bacteroides fragilis 3_1_12]